VQGMDGLMVGDPEVERPSADFERLFRTVFAPLVGALAVAAGSHEAAADAVQDAFVQAHRHWNEVAAYDNPAAWVRRVAVNRISNQHRSRRRYEAAVARVGGPEGTGAAAAPDVAVRLAVAHALAGLDDRDRLVVCLYYLADLPIAEVADLCASTVPAIKSVLHRARRDLGRTFGDER